MSDVNHEAFEEYMKLSREIEDELIAEMGKEAYDASKHWVNNPLISEISKVALFDEAIKRAKAEAWEEGFDAGERDVSIHDELNDWGTKDAKCIPNPYLEENK